MVSGRSACFSSGETAFAFAIASGISTTGELATPQGPIEADTEGSRCVIRSCYAKGPRLAVRELLCAEFRIAAFGYCNV